MTEIPAIAMAELPFYALDKLAECRPELLRERQRICLYPAGSMTAALLESGLLAGLEIVAVADRYLARPQWCGLPVLRPDAFDTAQIQIVLIASITYHREIVMQLLPGSARAGVTLIDLCENAPVNPANTWSNVRTFRYPATGDGTGQVSLHAADEIEPGWRVDLEGLLLLDHIMVFNREEAGRARGASTGTLSVSLSVDGVQWECIHTSRPSFDEAVDNQPLFVDCVTKFARFVRLQLDGRTDAPFDRIEVVGDAIRRYPGAALDELAAKHGLTNEFPEELCKRYEALLARERDRATNILDFGRRSNARAGLWRDWFRQAVVHACAGREPLAAGRSDDFTQGTFDVIFVEETAGLDEARREELTCLVKPGGHLVLPSGAIRRHLSPAQAPPNPEPGRVVIVSYASPDDRNQLRQWRTTAWARHWLDEERGRIESPLVRGDVLCFGPDSLDPDFRARNAKILAQRRGSGYWLWKPYILASVLASTNAEFLVYCDGGSLIHHSLSEVLGVFRGNDAAVLGFDTTSLGWVERKFTKGQVLRAMGATDPVFADTGQIVATASVWRVCAEARRIVDRWLTLMQDPMFSTDLPSADGLGDDPEFVEHRHDQSVYSLVLKTEAARSAQDRSPVALRDLSWLGHHVMG